MASKNTTPWAAAMAWSFPDLVCLGTEGFFADDVLAVLQEHLAVLVVEGVGAGHIHRVHFRGGGHGLDAGKGQFRAVAVRVGPGPLLGAGVDGGELP